ncbi:MAG: N-acetylmuramoyl-L-alanine amidase [Nanoarchaeota archaeon]|nr:N-acetylmuramoyl-L-alanine amidase [Nanoarchaeota archaeon]MBU1052034.1 N-acetylmuramoyl-L-alanine amidase [Nanoarchaeota archaeon]MBU1987879.1 N-acetylmuramoyl-L-alanine amidase [Nanoarchaeota archaeon]
MTSEQTRRDFMRKGLAILVSAAIPAFAQSEEPTSQPGKKVVVLDPGHGMGNRKKGVYDPGAVHEKIYEEKIVLDQSKRVGKILAQKGYDIISTRTDSETETPLSSRPILANQQNADIFVSLHCNAFTNPDAKGVRTYHYPDTKQGIKLARQVQDSLVEELTANIPGFEQKYNGLKTANFHVLKHTNMPAVLVESGFLTNERDRKYLTQNPEIVAEGIDKGIIKYLEEE